MIIAKDTLIDLLINTASMSTSKKRKVGAVILNLHTSELLATGYNHVVNDIEAPCEIDIRGQVLTREDVIHAEMDAINKLPYYENEDLIMFVSYPPCINCRAALQRIGLKYKVIKDEGDL